MLVQLFLGFLSLYDPITILKLLFMLHPPLGIHEIIEIQVKLVLVDLRRLNF